MKYLILILTFSLLLSLSTQGIVREINESTIIEAVKKNSEVITFLQEKSSPDNIVSYYEMPLDGICGFAGCESRSLVNVMIKSTKANAPTKHLLVRVTVNSLDEKSIPKMVIVSLK